ncbi:MAG: SPFH domain-containing protein [Candidatus Aminicenantes bacterium]|nr:MAG: SPFH domain-containing protein [Candidatus Aminicenantes bacterium]
MGFFEKLRAEFIDIIEWLDPSNDIMLHRFERYHNEIKNGAKLVVRESQVAVFVSEGQVADVFQPGMYTLETRNLPILTTIKGWKYGFNSPFKAEVYFANTKNFTDRKWGTKNPVMLRDPEFGPIRLRAFGTYALRIKDPVKVIKEIAGTDAHFTTDEITDQLRNIIVTRFTDSMAESKIPAIDMATQYDELSELLHEKINPEFDEYGFELTKFLVENVSFPPEVEEAIDKRSSMGVIGNLQNYLQYQTANALGDAARNPGGTAGEGIGLGMGFAMAHQMVGAFQQQHPQQVGAPVTPGPPPPIPGGTQYYAVINGQQAGPYNDMTLKQLIQQQVVNRDTLVWKQGMAQWSKAGQVPEVAALFAPQAPPPPPVPPK